MPHPRCLRVPLHLVLMVVPAIPGMAAPARSVMADMHAISVAQQSGEAPCATHVAASEAMQCDCCTPRGCDRSACLGVSCLPELPRVANVLPAAEKIEGWVPPSVDIVVMETPFRPPIA